MATRELGRLSWAAMTRSGPRTAAREVMYSMLGQVPGADPWYESRRHPSRLVAHRRRCEVVVEGYTGSANTWTAKAIAAANPGIRVAYHRHRASQILEGLRQGIPTICLVREPVDAIASSIVRGHARDVRLELARYSYFYAACRPAIEPQARVVVATFDEATTDVDGVIDRLNRVSGCNLAALRDLGPDGEAEVRRTIEASDRAGRGSDWRRVTALPSDERGQELARVRAELNRPEHARALRRCRGYFERFAAAAGQQRISTGR